MLQWSNSQQQRGCEHSLQRRVSWAQAVEAAAEGARVQQERKGEVNRCAINILVYKHAFNHISVDELI